MRKNLTKSRRSNVRLSWPPSDSALATRVLRPFCAHVLPEVHFRRWGNYVRCFLYDNRIGLFYMRHVKSHCWRCGRFVPHRAPRSFKGRVRFRMCPRCREHLTRKGRIALPEAQRFCERIALLFEAPCRVKVLPSPGRGVEWFRFGWGGGADGNRNKRLVACHTEARTDQRGRYWSCKITLDFRCFAGSRSRGFENLLKVMIHEIAHHFVSKDGHGNEWRRQCAIRAHYFGLTFRDCRDAFGAA